MRLYFQNQRCKWIKKTYNIMPKSASEQDTIISTNKAKQKKKVSGLLERTKQAVKYYSMTKHEDLKKARQKYLQKIGYQDTQNSKINEKKVIQKQQEEQYERQRSKPTCTESKPISSKKQSLQIDSQVIDKSYCIENYILDSQSSENLSQEGKYPLQKVHNFLIDLQKAIDNFLDFQYSHRSKRALSKQELIEYLKTTEYGLNCERYIKYLMIYHKKLYKWDKEMIICRKMDPQQTERRAEKTKLLMTRKYIQDIAI